jgi:chitin disaccharide deacetylase
VPSLLAPDGRFPGAALAARRLLSGRIAADELDRELDAQLARFRAVLGEPTHVDSHKHMHVFGRFVPAVVRMAGQLAVPRARCPREKVPLRRLCTPLGLKAAVLHQFAGRLRRALRQAGVAFPGHFTGTVQSHSLTSAALCRLIDGLGPGITELMCHPGNLSPDDHAVVANVACTPYRAPQVEALRDASVRRRLEENRVVLCHYGQLPPAKRSSHA